MTTGTLAASEPLVTRAAWTGSVAGGQTRTINVRASQFPVQSVGSATAITLDAVIEASGQAHLVGVRVPSAPLAARFTSDYLGVTLSGSDASEPSAIEPNLDAQTFINQVYTFSATDSLEWDKFLGNAPSTVAPDDQDPNGNRVCARISADFIDENRGETVYGASFAGNGYPAAYALVSVFAADKNKLLWSGNAGSDGCTPRLQGVSSGRFIMAVETTLRSFRALPPARDVRVNIADKNNAPLRQAIGFRIYPATPAPPTDIRIRLDATDTRMLITAALTQVLRTTTIAVPSAVYPVRTARCQGNDASATSFTACYADPVLWLGQTRDPGRTHNAQWKFVVAHEFGHGIQARYGVAPDTDYSAPVSQPHCQCEHVFDDADRSHCMQSKENYGGVGNESFAHLVSTSTWSGVNPGACTFVYYKETLTAPGPALTPPVAVDCASPVQWLKTQCAEAARGSEWDWNNWYRSVAVAPVTERTTVADLADIQRIACGGTSCATSSPSPDQFITAANNKYGSADDPRAKRFRDDGVAYGAKF